MLSCVSGPWVWLSGNCLSWATSPTDTTLIDKYSPTLWGSSSCDCPNRCSKCPWLSAGERHTVTHLETSLNYLTGPTGAGQTWQNTIFRETQLNPFQHEQILISPADSNYDANPASFAFLCCETFSSGIFFLVLLLQLNQLIKLINRHN